jgi:hypothetical protein
MVPRLDLCLADRAVYSHLVRHSRLEGKLQFRFSIAWLAEGARLCKETVRPALRRLVDHGALRVLEGSKAGHLVEVHVPEEIPAIWPDAGAAGKPARSEVAWRQPRRGGFFQAAGAAPGHPCARARPLFLLPATDQRAHAVHRSRGAAGGVRAKFLPQPGFLLCGVQREERRTPRGRVSPPALPRALLESPGPRRATPCPGYPHLGQTPPAASRAFLRAVYGRAVARSSGLRFSSWILKSTNLSVSAKGKRKDGLLRFQWVTSDRLASCTILPDSTALHLAGFGVTDSRGDL